MSNKIYTIGREASCNIVINDPTDVVSRRHAVLTVSSSGKMTITDTSSNGTYINGIRISKNVPVPVSRKDIVSFAHVTKLDWSLVPRSNAVRFALYALALIVVVAGAVLGTDRLLGEKDKTPEPAISVEDSLARLKAEQEKIDSLARVKADSIAKAKADSLAIELEKERKAKEKAAINHKKAAEEVKNVEEQKSGSVKKEEEEEEVPPMG